MSPPTFSRSETLGLVSIALRGSNEKCFFIWFIIDIDLKLDIRQPQCKYMQYNFKDVLIPKINYPNSNQI
jgi:hypothetical protein